MIGKHDYVIGKIVSYSSPLLGPMLDLCFAGSFLKTGDLMPQKYQTHYIDSNRILERSLVCLVTASVWIVDAENDDKHATGPRVGHEAASIGLNQRPPDVEFFGRKPLMENVPEFPAKKPETQETSANRISIKTVTFCG